MIKPFINHLPYILKTIEIFLSVYTIEKNKLFENERLHIGFKIIIINLRKMIAH